MQAISQGELELVRFDTNGLLRGIQGALFPKVTAQVTCHYGHIPTLSFVEGVGENRYVISLHSMFNHPDTPELVVRHILIHELLHLEVPARALREGEVDPRLSKKKGQEPQEPLGPIAHPAEFWVRERELSPDRMVAMRWIFEAFRGRLEYRAREEQFRVRKWRSEFGRRVVRPTIEQVRAVLSEQEKEYPGMDGES